VRKFLPRPRHAHTLACSSGTHSTVSVLLRCYLLPSRVGGFSATLTLLPATLGLSELSSA